VESETCKKELVIEVPPNIVKEEADTVTAHYRRMARIPGFRPGRAPVSLVRRHFQEDIRNEVVQTLLPKYFENAVKEQNMAVVGQPHFADLKFEDDSPLTCKATFEILPEFDLKDYKGLAADEVPSGLTDADVTRLLEELQERVATFELVDDRAAQDGDYVTVNYRGVDSSDTAATPLEATDALVHLAGEGTVPAFTENLRAVKPGDVREFEVAYPENYATKSLAGKTFHYRVEVQAVKRKVVPALDDDFAKSVSESKTMEELRTQISENLAERKKREAEAAAKQGLLDQLVNAHSFPVPDVLVDSQLEARLERVLAQLLSQGVDPRTVGIDWQKLREEGRPEAEKDVRGSLVLEKIAKAEGIEVTEEEVDEVIRDLAKERHEAPAAVKTRLTRDHELSRIKGRLRNQKALDLIYRNAKIQKKSETALPQAEAQE
jgi:trigger factor